MTRIKYTPPKTEKSRVATDEEQKAAMLALFSIPELKEVCKRLKDR